MCLVLTVVCVCQWKNAVWFFMFSGKFDDEPDCLSHVAHHSSSAWLAAEFERRRSQVFCVCKPCCCYCCWLSNGNSLLGHHKLWVLIDLEPLNSTTSQKRSAFEKILLCHRASQNFWAPLPPKFLVHHGVEEFLPTRDNNTDDMWLWYIVIVGDYAMCEEQTMPKTWSALLGNKEFFWHLFELADCY